MWKPILVYSLFGLFVFLLLRGFLWGATTNPDEQGAPLKKLWYATLGNRDKAKRRAQGK